MNSFFRLANYSVFKRRNTRRPQRPNTVYVLR